MSNLSDVLEVTRDGLRAARVGESAGAEQLGASVYELHPGDEMVFHYHVQREELLVVLSGRLSLRTATGHRPAVPRRHQCAQQPAARAQELQLETRRQPHQPRMTTHKHRGIEEIAFHRATNSSPAVLREKKLRKRSN